MLFVYIILAMSIVPTCVPNKHVGNAPENRKRLLQNIGKGLLPNKQHEPFVPSCLACLTCLACPCALRALRALRALVPCVLYVLYVPCVPLGLAIPRTYSDLLNYTIFTKPSILDP